LTEDPFSVAGPGPVAPRRPYVERGQRACRFSQVAAILSEAVAWTITYRDITLDAFREQLMASGAPAWLVDVRMQFTSVLREGFAEAVTDAVLRTTGVPPRSFRLRGRARRALR
jgi:hypothetical protein